MAKKTFLLQGFTSDTHLQAVRRLFQLPALKEVILSVAFANRAGVDLLASELMSAGSKVHAYIGIRNDITSRQGLQALMACRAKVHYIDTGARQVIFHPKLYFARNKDKANMVVGSANLTPGGLNNNIEASLVSDLNLTNTDDLSLAKAVAAAFKGLTSDYPEHVVRLKRIAQLDKLQEEGRLLDEASSSPPRTVISSAAAKSDDLPRIKLKVNPIRRTVRRDASSPKKKTARKSKSGGTTPKSQAHSAATGAQLELVWESKPLTERDLTIPSGANTNATGSINLDKGLLEEDIDHRHYFRNDVFPSLSWRSRSRTVDEAHATFGLIVKGVEYGEFELRIGHTISTTSKAYLQRNAMTRLSWGPMKPYVAQEGLIGRTMSLFRNVSAPTRFVIEID